MAPDEDRLPTPGGPDIVRTTRRRAEGNGRSQGKGEGDEG
jgi:hypothetical protein